ncbi:type 1 glutamine amidotransferase domain-containing protein [Nocardia otitidiscaviarum]|uniref:Type 1 glutamine amidotransferase n=1 Tax=Nocardia otitidiscaviarum TaxID=1823 RepID=A0A516NR44_9NOCA|nr:type 1 glutamine amidotransferase domain-containing protein [Nocardia otitidiscaviarum]MBF6181676.1 type 1 glutamine amidotransferase [Nocardia otitidiscaviarum]MCP9619374.1 type 1 glutamine amidotransferase [Nocardia otitidiscaviarum]QDP81361.1 type 1 glutamine amidotransferase [Nocardia otitidiscaviarum]
MSVNAKVLVITSNTGVERDELLVPVRRLRDSGAQVVHAAPEKEAVRTVLHDTEQAIAVDPDASLDSVAVEDYAALVIPGGTVNADKLRLTEPAVEVVRSFAAAGKTIAAICHGPWLLVEADLIRGRSLTSYPSLRTDIRNAGGEWTDEPMVRSANGWTLITSRNPGDLDDFTGAILTDLGG